MANPHFTLKRKAVAAVLISEFLVGDQVKRGKTRDWVKRRNEQGLISNLVKELSIEDTSAFKEMMRINYEDFFQVLGYIERDITPKPINGGHEVIRLLRGAPTKGQQHLEQKKCLITHSTFLITTKHD